MEELEILASSKWWKLHPKYAKKMEHNLATTFWHSVVEASSRGITANDQVVVLGMPWEGELQRGVDSRRTLQGKIKHLCTKPMWRRLSYIQIPFFQTLLCISWSNYSTFPPFTDDASAPDGKLLPCPSPEVAVVQLWQMIALCDPSEWEKNKISPPKTKQSKPNQTKTKNYTSFQPLYW